MAALVVFDSSRAVTFESVRVWKEDIDSKVWPILIRLGKSERKIFKRAKSHTVPFSHNMERERRGEELGLLRGYSKFALSVTE